MEENHEVKHEVAIATMQTDIGYLKSDVREIKGDIKDQGIVLDNLAKNWQEFGGLSKMMADQNVRLNAVERITRKNEIKILIASFVLSALSIIMVPVFINVVSVYIQNHIR